MAQVTHQHPRLTVTVTSRLVDLPVSPVKAGGAKESNKQACLHVLPLHSLCQDPLWN